MYPIVAERIRSLCTGEHGEMTRLAQAAGIPYSTLMSIFYLHVEPRAYTIGCIATALKTTADYLIGLSNDPRRPK